MFRNLDAITDLVGVIILIAVIAVVIGSVGITFLSGISKDTTPAVLISHELVEDESGKYLYLKNEGGDTLYREATIIIVNGEEATSSFKTLSDEDWSLLESSDEIRMAWNRPEIPFVAILSNQNPDNPTVIYMDENAGVVPTQTSTHTPTQTLTPTPTITIPPVADFIGYPLSGKTTLSVDFTDLSTGSPTSWFWNFGDNSTSNAQNPLHNYTEAGNYTVSLTVTNAGGSDIEIKTGYINVTLSFVDYIINENVFVYGYQLEFEGGTVTGSGSTIVVKGGGITTEDLNGGASLSASNIYIDGPVYLDGGSANLGSEEYPGVIAVNGDVTLWSGDREVYGDLYVNGDFAIKDANIHGDVYVNGNLELGWTPSFDSDSYIYYTGTITHPGYYPQNILDRCIKVDSVTVIDMPDYEIPSAKTSDWYTSREYMSGGTLSDGLKIYADSYSSSGWISSAENVVIVAANGDISLTDLGDSFVTGILFAPNGKVTFDGGGAIFEGVVIAKDGFFVISGGTNVVFRNLSDYISDSDNYPF